MSEHRLFCWKFQIPKGFFPAKKYVENFNLKLQRKLVFGYSNSAPCKLALLLLHLRLLPLNNPFLNDLNKNYLKFQKIDFCLQFFFFVRLGAQGYIVRNFFVV